MQQSRRERGGWLGWKANRCVLWGTAKEGGFPGRSCAGTCWCPCCHLCGHGLGTQGVRRICRRAVRRGVAVATAKTCEVAASPTEVASSTGVASATAVLRGSWLERHNKGSHSQDRSSRLRRQAKPRVALHVRTLSANRGGRGRFYTIRRGSARLRCCPCLPRRTDPVEMKSLGLDCALDGRKHLPGPEAVQIYSRGDSVPAYWATRDSDIWPNGRCGNDRRLLCPARRHGAAPNRR